MALVLPIILLILLGILEFGRIMNAYMTISMASREGARLAALGGSTTEIVARVDDTASYLTVSDLHVAISPSSGASRGDIITVTVTYDQHMMIPMMGAILGDPLEMNADTTMRVE